MIVLPKVPHSLRSLTQSFARTINPAASSQPSVTFSSQGSSVHVIGGGGPFTHNSSLLGGGALTRTGGASGSGTGVGFENWAPSSGGGGGAGAGSRNPGAGSYGGYTVSSTFLLDRAQLRRGFDLNRTKLTDATLRAYLSAILGPCSCSDPVYPVCGDGPDLAAGRRRRRVPVGSLLTPSQRQTDSANDRRRPPKQVETQK